MEQYLTLGAFLLCMAYIATMIVVQASDAARARAARKRREKVRKTLDLFSK